MSDLGFTHYCIVTFNETFSVTFNETFSVFNAVTQGDVSILVVFCIYLQFSRI